MKFLFIFALALACVSADDIFSRDIYVPVIGTEGRISNGQNAVPGQFKYQVGISLRVNILSTAWCGGSLINKNWILTAAHCTDGIQGATIYLGATIRTSAEKTYSISKSDIVIHSDWNANTLKNDISLIRIPSVSESSKIGFIQLPSNNNDKYVGRVAIASGWGRISDSANGVANNLQFGKMTVEASSACTKNFGTVFTDSTQICVSTPNRVSPCQGDSGGPLVLENTTTQIGLVSFGSKAGCAKGYPVAFTRVSAYLTWIKSHTG